MRYLFDFGELPPAEGALKVKPDSRYSDHARYGFIKSRPIISRINPEGNRLNKDYCYSDGPFLFRVDIPEGNYRITIYPGPEIKNNGLTIKAESRRLIVKDWLPENNSEQEFQFTVNVSSPRLRSGDEIPFSLDEHESRNWNNSLNLEFLGKQPSIAAIKIESESESATLFLAGDSTVCDQVHEPWAAWGQMLPSFFREGLAVANHAKSGGSLKSFLKEHRLEKIYEQMKPGDFLFLQFAHNDQKPGEFHSAPWEDYKKLLMEVSRTALSRGVQPVIFTPVQRRRFNDSGEFYLTLEDYPEAAKSAAEELNIPLIDLAKISKTFFKKLGVEKSKKAFLHLPAGSYPKILEDLEDDTHFSSYGACQLAAFIVSMIRTKTPKTAQFLRPNTYRDPENPELPDNWKWDESPLYNE